MKINTHFIIFSLSILACSCLQAMYHHQKQTTDNVWINTIKKISKNCCRNASNAGTLCCMTAPVIFTTGVALGTLAYKINSNPKECIACLAFAGVGCCAIETGHLLNQLDEKYKKQNDAFFTSHQDKYE